MAKDAHSTSKAFKIGLALPEKTSNLWKHRLIVQRKHRRIADEMTHAKEPKPERERPVFGSVKCLMRRAGLTYREGPIESWPDG